MLCLHNVDLLADDSGCQLSLGLLLACSPFYSSERGGIGPGDTDYRDRSPQRDGSGDLRASLQQASARLHASRSGYSARGRLDRHGLPGRWSGYAPGRWRSRSPVESRHPVPGFRPQRAVLPRPSSQAAVSAPNWDLLFPKLGDLGAQVQQLSRSQAETQRQPLSRPLLASVDSFLPELPLDQEGVERLHRCLRLADSLQDADHLWPRSCL